MNLETMSHTNVQTQAAQTQAAQLPGQSLLLRRALQADTLVSGLSGLLALVDARVVATMLGFTTAVATRNVMLLGLGLLAWAAFAFWASTRPTLTRGVVFTFIEGNLLWVVGSVLVIMTGWLPLSTSGKWIIAIVADVVGLLALWQYIGWRRLIKR